MERNNVERIEMPWYLQTWFISLLFALWFCIFPAVLGVVLLVMQHRFMPKVAKEILSEAILERDNLKNEIRLLTAERDSEKKKLLSELEGEAQQLRNQIDSLKLERDQEKEKIFDELKAQHATFMSDITAKTAEISVLNERIQELEDSLQKRSRELLDLDEKLLYQDFGLYEPKYNCTSSDEYKEKISEIRSRQKAMISEKTALSYTDNWVLDGSKAKGRAMNNDNMKMVLLAFNGECDSIIQKVKFNNVDRIEERIKKIAEKVNRLNNRNQISITKKYISLKLEELYLSYEYERKKQDEKEEARRIREEEREAQKLEKELAEARKNIDKEKKHYSNALESAKQQIDSASDEERPALLEKIQELENKLESIQNKIADLDYREANTKAGYVYIISNIGSFGENVYKIGMTRRLDPMDRINELGDASVPFKFDVHAIIFSDDAPKLEAALHNAFDDRKVNMVNGRKEFFNVQLDEIEQVVKQNYEKTVDFHRNIDAEEFRETQMLRKQMN